MCEVRCPNCFASRWRHGGAMFTNISIKITLHTECIQSLRRALRNTAGMKAPRVRLLRHTAPKHFTENVNIHIALARSGGARA
eukprot:15350344-Alexandrium_andersonii.AAC.1